MTISTRFLFLKSFSFHIAAAGPMEDLLIRLNHDMEYADLIVLLEELRSQNETFFYVTGTGKS